MTLRSTAWSAVALVLLAAVVVVGPGCSPAHRGSSPAGGGAQATGAIAPRPFRPFSGDRWIGEAICYGPFRDGQRPGGPAPSREELGQDLRILARHWGLIRLYGSVGSAEPILEIIRTEQLDLKVLLGIWIDAEERRDSTGLVIREFPEARASNRAEIEAGVRLANAFPEIVIGVAVGNETLVDWSPHRGTPGRIIACLREVRGRVGQPVTTVDDRNWWNLPESRAVAAEVDFIVVHLHPLWGGASLESSIDWIRNHLEVIRRLHPDREIVIGETGWATRRNDVGDQGRLIRGRTGEPEQTRFLEALGRWVRAERIPTFVFEAFDENWKGGAHPDDVEKHWGLFHADRTPKAAMAGRH